MRAEDTERVILDNLWGGEQNGERKTDIVKRNHAPTYIEERSSSFLARCIS